MTVNVILEKKFLYLSITLKYQLRGGVHSPSGPLMKTKWWLFLYHKSFMHFYFIL